MCVSKAGLTTGCQVTGHRQPGPKMKVNKMFSRLIQCALMVLLGIIWLPVTAQTGGRVTILNDAFGKASQLKKDWGWAALIEYNGKRILFDTGNNNELFAHNVKTLGVDLTKLDFAVISHRHGDHTGGLNHVLDVNPNVTIYAPSEITMFGTPTRTPSSSRRPTVTLPEYMRYFDGKDPGNAYPTGTPWLKAKFKQIDNLTEIIPGFFLIPVVSDVAGTKEMRELSMAVMTPKGLVLVVGCAHPGIEKILEATTKIDKRIYSVFGGFHLVGTPDPEISRMATAFRDQWKIERMAPGHCTGEFAFAQLQNVFGNNYDYAGVGTVIELE